MPFFVPGQESVGRPPEMDPLALAQLGDKLDLWERLPLTTDLSRDSCQSERLKQFFALEKGGCGELSDFLRESRERAAIDMASGNYSAAERRCCERRQSANLFFGEDPDFPLLVASFSYLRGNILTEWARNGRFLTEPAVGYLLDAAHLIFSAESLLGVATSEGGERLLTCLRYLRGQERMRPHHDWLMGMTGTVFEKTIFPSSIFLDGREIF